MTCKYCPKPYTFDMTQRCCQIKHLRMIPMADAQAWLRNYKAANGHEATLQLIEDTKREP